MLVFTIYIKVFVEYNSILFCLEVSLILSCCFDVMSMILFDDFEAFLDQVLYLEDVGALHDESHFERL